MVIILSVDAKLSCVFKFHP